MRRRPNVTEISIQNIRGPTVRILQWMNTPILWLSLIGTVIATIWLVIVGERWVLLYGIGGSLLSYVLGLVAVLQFVLFRAARRQAASAKRLRGLLLVIVAQLLTYSVVSVWCHLTFGFFVSKATSSTMIPLLIVSWGVALAPWHFLTSKERDQEWYHGHGEFLLLLNQIGYVLGVIAYMARDVYALPPEPIDAMRAVAATHFSLVFYGVLRMALIIHTMAAIYDHVISVVAPATACRPKKPAAIRFTVAILTIALCIDGVRAVAVLGTGTDLASASAWLAQNGLRIGVMCLVLAMVAYGIRGARVLLVAHLFASLAILGAAVPIAFSRLNARAIDMLSVVFLDPWLGISLALLIPQLILELAAVVIVFAKSSGEWFRHQLRDRPSGLHGQLSSSGAP